MNMNTKDIIIGEVDYGSFRFPMQFKAFGGTQIIADAVFDTGCSHSLISFNSLNRYGKSLEDIQRNILYNKDSILGIGVGVESKGSDLEYIKQLVNKINHYKEICKNENELENLIDKNITLDDRKMLFDSKNVRYKYPITGLVIDNVPLGNFDIMLSYGTNGINLIGMHIIKELYTKIYHSSGKTYMFAMKNSNNMDEMDSAMREVEEYIDLCKDK